MFDVMIGLLYQVATHINVSNTSTPVFYPIPIVGRHSTPVYGRWMTGEGN